MDPSIQEKVAAALAELGLPAPANVIQTMLMRRPANAVEHVAEADAD